MPAITLPAPLPAPVPASAIELELHVNLGGPSLDPGKLPRKARVMMRAQGWTAANQRAPVPRAVTSPTTELESTAILATVAQPGETLEQLMLRAASACMMARLSSATPATPANPSPSPAPSTASGPVSAQPKK